MGSGSWEPGEDRGSRLAITLLARPLSAVWLCEGHHPVPRESCVNGIRSCCSESPAGSASLPGFSESSSCRAGGRENSALASTAPGWTASGQAPILGWQEGSPFVILRSAYFRSGVRLRLWEAGLAVWIPEKQTPFQDWWEGKIPVA